MCLIKKVEINYQSKTFIFIIGIKIIIFKRTLIIGNNTKNGY